MAKPKTLAKAANAYAARRFSEAISLLESQVFRFRENFEFFYLLGMSCLRVGDYGGAYSYLKRAQQINPNDGNTSLGLAIVHVRRRETPRALQEWLSVLDGDPKNRRARRGLDLLRGVENQAELEELAESTRLEALLPSPGVRPPRWLIPGMIGGAAIALFLLFGLDPIVERRRAPATTRDGLEVVGELPEEITNYEGSFRYVLSEREIERSFQRIGEYFNEFRDSMARREINRLIHSNASAAVKERARLLIDYLQAPTFVNFRDEFGYTEVAREPWLYEGCWVKWRGRVSNVEIGAQLIRFVLLVGYEDEVSLEGTVPVRFTRAVDVQVPAVEVIGQVVLEENRLVLDGTGIRQIVPRSEG